jgi:hypothetical protein
MEKIASWFVRLMKTYEMWEKTMTNRKTVLQTARKRAGYVEGLGRRREICYDK